MSLHDTLIVLLESYLDGVRNNAFTHQQEQVLYDSISDFSLDKETITRLILAEMIRRGLGHE